MTPQMPSRRGLLLRLAAAAGVGAFIVFCVVLPAEYRKDPTGFGRLTGLIELTTPRVAESDPASDPALAEFPEASETPKNPKANTSHEKAWRSETIKIPMGPDGELEYKFKMKPGDTLVYSWSVDRGMVYYDFHGQPEDPKKSQSYKEVQEATTSHGAFVAPFDGIHGWYFLNLTGQPLTVTLNVAGFYESHDYVR